MNGNGHQNESCTAFAALLPRLPDADLEPETAARLTAHLDACDACRAEAEVFRGLGGVLREATPAVTLPPGAHVVRHIMEAEREPRLARWFSAFPSWGWAGAAAAALLFATALSRGPAPDRAAAPPPAETEQLLVITDDERTGRRVVQAPYLENTAKGKPTSTE